MSNIYKIKKKKKYRTNPSGQVGEDDTEEKRLLVEDHEMHIKQY